VLADYQVPNHGIIHLWDRAWNQPIMRQISHADDLSASARMMGKTEKQLLWERLPFEGHLAIGMVSEIEVGRPRIESLSNYKSRSSLAPALEYECIVCHCPFRKVCVCVVVNFVWKCRSKFGNTSWSSTMFTCLESRPR